MDRECYSGVPVMGRTVSAWRSQIPSVCFLRWAGKAIKGMKREIVDDHHRCDDVAVTWCFSTAARVYSLASSFVLAHALLVVWGDTLQRRRSICLTCSHKKTDAFGIDRCHGYPDGSCRCPQNTWWLPGRLSYQQRLRNKVCTRGHFGRLAPKEVDHGNSNIHRGVAADCSGCV